MRATACAALSLLALAGPHKAAAQRTGGGGRGGAGRGGGGGHGGCNQMGLMAAVPRVQAACQASLLTGGCDDTCQPVLLDFADQCRTMMEVRPPRCRRRRRRRRR